MKLLIIPSWYSTEDKQHNGIFFTDQAESLQTFGLSVAVAYSDLRSRLGTLRRGIYKDYDAKVPTYLYRKRDWMSFTGKNNIQKRIEMLEALYQRVCQDMDEPDIVHLHSCRAGPEVIALCRAHNLPLIYTEHYSGILGEMDEDLRYRFESTLEACDCAVAVSEDMRTRMVTKRPDTLLIPNLVDTDTFKIMPGVVPQGEFVFAASGNLLPAKGYDLLLRAFESALPSMPGARIIIAGSGEQEATLREIITELKLEDRAELAGFIPRTISPKFYNSCDCFVCSSFSETFGASIIEALSCGKPVIATKCGGPESIVNKKNGMLINAGDIPAMSKALIHMYHSARGFNPFLIREDCINRFGRNYVCQRLVQLYAHTLQNKGNI